MLYFYILDQAEFLHGIRPALSLSWQRRSFEPCRDLCRDLTPRARAFFPGSEHRQQQCLLEQVAEGLAFDRRFWQSLVGEVLMYSAVDVPRLETAAETLCCLLAPAHFGNGVGTHDCLTPIQQAHFGSRDLVFGGGHYRPDSAGWNDAEDVARLDRYLAAQSPAQWSATSLERLGELGDNAARAAELDYVRHCFASLCDMYREARASGRIVVSEELS